MKWFLAKFRNSVGFPTWLFCSLAISSRHIRLVLVGKKSQTWQNFFNGFNQVLNISSFTWIKSQIFETSLSLRSYVQLWASYQTLPLKQVKLFHWYHRRQQSLSPPKPHTKWKDKWNVNHFKFVFTRWTWKCPVVLYKMDSTSPPWGYLLRIFTKDIRWGDSVRIFYRWYSVIISFIVLYYIISDCHH